MSREVVKMKQGMSYSSKEKTIILNVFKYFQKTHPQKCVTAIVRCTAKATGCSEKSVFRFRKEEASPQGFKEPSKTKVRKNININNRLFKYDDSVRESIKSIIYNLKYENIHPSLSMILKNVNSNEKLPNFSLMTLRRLLFDMGFSYEREKSSNKPVLIEKTDNKDNIKEQVQSLLEKDAKNSAILLAETSKNQIYAPHQDIHPSKSMPVGYQHSMLLNHRVIHPYHSVHPHNLQYIEHHPHQSHNPLI